MRAPTQLRRVAVDREVGGGGCRRCGIPFARRPRPYTLHRFVEQNVHGNAAAGRCLLRLDEAEIEQVVDDPAEPVGLAQHLVGERLRRLGSSLAASVSASRASAPIGVLSSWLTLATKSRRTLSSAPLLGHVADEADRADAGSPSSSSGSGVDARAPRAAGRRAAARVRRRSPSRASAARRSKSSAAAASEWRASRNRSAAVLRTSSRPRQRRR